MTARFNHPNIVTIYSAGEHSGQVYLALEYLRGENLKHVIKKRRLGLSEVIKIAVDVSAALKEAHSHDMLHLDLKPSNIFRCSDGRIKVLDFGLARPADAEPTEEDLSGSDVKKPQYQAGTPTYMEPEQWQRRGRSKATDIWAFGTVLYELLTGSRPYVNFEVRA